MKGKHNMVSIILAYNDLAKREALALGFKEEKVLVRHESCESDKRNEDRIITEIIGNIHPYQFLVADYWGASPD